MKYIAVIALAIFSLPLFGQQPAQRSGHYKKIDTTNLDLTSFAAEITGNETDEYEKAKKILYWLSANFEWKATDYKTRSVNEIMAQGGGNCFELARVYIALVKKAGITYRSVAEINIHPVTERRQETAARLVAQRGNSLSVFGLQHNDHRWLEVYDKKNDRWEPADPSAGVIGLNDWLKARVWFGERKTIDTVITREMIVPFAIFHTGTGTTPVESRTTYYLIESFNELYGGKLAGLPEWNEWVRAVNGLTEPAKQAFLGKQNLHEYQGEISKLAVIYERLRQAFFQKYGKG